MKKPIIICTDDEPLVLQAMRNELYDSFGNDYLIETCETGGDTLQLIDELKQAEEDIPLVIVDYLLTDMRGDELLRRIQEKLPSTQKIMLTGVGNEHEVAKAIQAVHLYGYISKPWEHLALMFTAKGAIETYQLEKKNRQQNHQLKELNANLEQKIAERTQKLEDLVALRDKILSIVGHDLRSPLASLQSTLLLINRDMVSEEERKELLQDLSIRMSGTLSLIENLFNWASQQMGGIRTKATHFPFVEVVQQVIKTLGAIAKDKHISILYDVDETLQVWADRAQIQLVLRNLVSNAIKFTNIGGSISIRTQTKSTFLEVSVTDDGIGIPPSILNDLFSAQKVVSRKGTAKEPGTGLGLMLCHEFVRLNGGTISAQSHEGKGATFIFTIPLNAQAE